MEFDLDIILQALGAVVAAIVGLSQIANRMPKSRTRLKHDLEILGQLTDDDPNRQIVQRYVDNEVEHIYGGYKGKKGRSRGFMVYDWTNLIFGAILLFGGVVWTLWLSTDGFSWWSLLAGFMALAGLGNILNGLRKPDDPLPVQPVSKSD